MFRLLAIVALAAQPGTGSACALLAPFDMGQISEADIVVVGRVVDYSQVEGVWNAALVTVSIEESLKGSASGEVTFVWNGGLAQGPNPSRAKGRVVIGAMKSGRIAIGDVTPDERPDLPSIVQPYCGEVWMQPATARSVAAARESLDE
jgi:hypothetical protein